MAASAVMNALADQAPEGQGRVLVAGRGLSELAEGLWRAGYAVAGCSDSRTPLEHIRTRPVDVLVVEHNLPGLGGIEICRRVKHDRSTRLTPVVLVLGGRPSRVKRLEGIEAGADELISRNDDIRHTVARVQSLVRRKRFTDGLEQTTSIMIMLAAMLETRGHYAEGHCHRMANYAAALGRRLGFDHQEQEIVRRSAFLHDIGMLGIPEAVLLKPEALEPDEVALVRSHPVIGESLVGHLRSLRPVSTIIRHHHERRDGSGYPDGLYGDEISPAAEIVRVVETYEALTSPRPYQSARSSPEAMDILLRQVELGWHRGDLVSEFASVVQAGGAFAQMPYKEGHASESQIQPES